ncbi:MAG: sensor domain-containing diguanylate cyclase [Clostridia bacterium]|nr:MAG: sensor domain-containing diguanylate cyclase [Clostridia bacterium]
MQSQQAAVTDELTRCRQEIERLRRELDERRRESELLYEINKAINTLLVPEEIAGLIMQAVVTLTNADACSIMLLDEADGVRIIADFGLADPEGEKARFAREYTDSMAWHVCKSGQPYVLQDPEVYDCLGCTLNDYVAAIPFIFDKEVLGTLNIHRIPSRYVLTDWQVEFLYNLAGQAALALKNALMYLEIKRQAMLLEQRAVTDGLTSLYNHLHFHQTLSAEIRAAQENGQPLSIILGDLDFFKRLNDTYGHLFGDTVLKEVAGIMSLSVAAAGGIAARYGGEEFAAILPDTPLAGAAEIARDIRQRVASHPFADPEDGQEVKVTMSLGVAEWVAGEAKSDFIDRADTALYRAKQEGRNRVVAAQ